jgi:multiple sugar transport system substrate-binding protein
MSDWNEKRRHPIQMAAAAALVLAAAGCGGSAPDAEPEVPAGPTVLEVWAHSGQAAEREALEEQVAAFNEGHESAQVRLTFIPEGSYNAQVQSAALAGDLPDVLDFDGPFVYNYAWQGKLMPLDGHLGEALLERLLPSIVQQGTYNGKLYSVGQFDSGLGLYARRSMLEAAGVRIPAGPQDAWSLTEFEAALAALAENDDDGQVLDLKLNYTGEWFTYAFSPALRSAGGGLIDRTDYAKAGGVLNSDASVTALRAFQRWIDEENYVDPNVDDNAFVGGRVALSWVGHWEYARYHDAHGDDLVVAPLPDFGEGTRTGQGSWNWGIAADTEWPDVAVLFLRHLMEDEQVLAMANANNAVPATRGAIAESPLYAEGGPLRLFAVQLREGYSVPRPRTPAYPVITSVFQQAFDDIANGADVRDVLDTAAREVDRDIEDNEGYPPPDAR